ncbi:MAG: permease-like cell division protein FtsX [Chitinophagales bacterium]
MAHQAGKSVSKKSGQSYLYSIISITLVLTMFGILSSILIFSNKISSYLKENVEISLILKDKLNEVDVLQFQKKLDIQPYILNSEFVSKDDAAKILQEEFGEDLDILGYNPLYSSINIHLKAAYANPDSLVNIENELRNHIEVQEVHYFKGLIDILSKNIRNISIVLSSILLVLLLITITLIDNTIKLAMYSNRFLIKSMQLVGATRWFIIRPFILRGFLNGVVSGLLAVCLLLGLAYYSQNFVNMLFDQKDIIEFSILFIGLIIVGALISGLSTFFAVHKYLRMKLDDLY